MKNKIDNLCGAVDLLISKINCFSEVSVKELTDEIEMVSLALKKISENNSLSLFSYDYEDMKVSLPNPEKKEIGNEIAVLSKNDEIITAEQYEAMIDEVALIVAESKNYSVLDNRKEMPILITLSEIQEIYLRCHSIPCEKAKAKIILQQVISDYDKSRSLTTQCEKVCYQMIDDNLALLSQLSLS